MSEQWRLAVGAAPGQTCPIAVRSAAFVACSCFTTPTCTAARGFGQQSSRRGPLASRPARGAWPWPLWLPQVAYVPKVSVEIRPVGVWLPAESTARRVGMHAGAGLYLDLGITASSLQALGLLLGIRSLVS